MRDAASSSTDTVLLERLRLDHHAAALSSAWPELRAHLERGERLRALQLLQSAGMQSVGERQRLVNSLSKLLKSGDWRADGSFVAGSLPAVLLKAPQPAPAAAPTAAPGEDGWWPALFSALSTDDDDPAAATAASLRAGRAAAHLGLLGVAAQWLESAARHGGADVAAEAAVEAREVAARAAAVGAYDEAALRSETARLRAAVGEEVASSWLAAVARRGLTAAAHAAQLVALGLVEEEEAAAGAGAGAGAGADAAATATAAAAAAAASGLLSEDQLAARGAGGGGGAAPPPHAATEAAAAAAAARLEALATYRALLYQAKKQLQHGASAAGAHGGGGGGGGGLYHCAPPAALCTPGLPPLLSAAQLETLRRERLVVADGALPAELVGAASAELRRMVAHGVLRADADDVCNPRQRRADLQLWRAAAAAEVARAAPALARCIAHVWCAPQLIGAAHGLRLRVPQTVMLAAYPPGAYYRKHLDSYRGDDIPRLLTILLYLTWEPREGGALRAHPPHPPGGDGGGEGGPPPREIAPEPGRLVVFYSQEVPHEVLPSVGERHALTVWVWDEKRDRHGR